MEQIKHHIDTSTPTTPLDDLNLKSSQPILAQYPEDSEWYRAEVLEWNKYSNVVSVRYVDYGNTADVSVSLVSEIPSELISFLPRQAIICRLSGFDEGVSGEGVGEGEMLGKLEELASSDESLRAEVVRVWSGEELEVRVSSDSCEDFTAALLSPSPTYSNSN